MKIGDQVRIKDPGDYISEVRKKIDKNRVGEVIGFSSHQKFPIVNFPAVGRRKEYRLGGVNEMSLEIVEQECDSGSCARLSV